jgi:hypothetical protein
MIDQLFSFLSLKLLDSAAVIFVLLHTLNKIGNYNIKSAQYEAGFRTIHCINNKRAQYLTMLYNFVVT